MKNILILGATGSLGGAFMRECLVRGWNVRALSRKKSGFADGVEWILGDAENLGDVMAAANGVDAIFHAVNPAGYKNWEVSPELMLENTIKAAKKAGAIILFPGNIYNYAPILGENIADNSPQNPISEKGMIRVRLEELLEKETDIKTIILRMGDFFGPQSGSSWLTEGIIQKNKPINSISSPSKTPNIRHQWAYLPDCAKCFAELLEKADGLPNFSRFNFDNHYFSNAELAGVIGEITGHDIKINQLPWWLFTLIAPFNITISEIIKMRYLWDYEMRFDGAGLKEILGNNIPHTDLKPALRETLKYYGCL